MKTLQKLCISCGGTGGHFYPGLAVAAEWQKQGGKVLLLIGGCQSMPGAAVLATGAALKSGCGLVTLHSTARAEQAAISCFPSAMLSEDAGECFSRVPDGLLRFTAIAVGPGLGRATETMDFVKLVATRTSCRLVLDADALFAFARLPEVLAECKERPILTPHLGEMARLMGVETETLKGSLVPAAQKLAKGCKAVVVAKSDTTLTAYPEGEVFFSALGNPVPQARRELLAWRQEKGIKDIERRLFSKGIDNVTFLT